MAQVVKDLNPVLRGWAGYFGFSQWRELPSLQREALQAEQTRKRRLIAPLTATRT